MNSRVTLKDVARAAGVSETTVSLVVNGKAARRGINTATQSRVANAIRQLGYQPDVTSRRIALHQGAPRVAARPDGISNGRSQIEEREPSPSRQHIGLVLSAASQTDVLTLVPIQESTLLREGYRLSIAVVPADPMSARERINQLLAEDPVGLIACPSVYTVAKEATGCPVIVLWQGSAKAILAALKPAQAPTPSPSPAPQPISSASPAAPTPTPLPQSPVAPIKTTAPAPIPPTVIPIMPKPMPAIPAMAPIQSSIPKSPAPEPEIQEAPPDATVVTPEPIPEPEPVIAETPVVIPEVIPEPVMAEEPLPAPEPTPEPVTMETPAPETPPPEPTPIPVDAPAETIAPPTPPPEEPAPAPVVEVPVPTPPVTLPPVIDTEPEPIAEANPNTAKDTEGQEKSTENTLTEDATAPILPDESQPSEKTI